MDVSGQDRLRENPVATDAWSVGMTSWVSRYHQVASLILIAPLLISMARIFLALAILLWSEYPAVGEWVWLVVIGVLLVLVDGRISRMLRGRPSVGGTLDTTADVVFVSTLLVMAVGSDRQAWIDYVIAAQCITLMGAAAAHMLCCHYLAPPSDASYAANAVCLIVTAPLYLHPSVTSGLFSMLLGIAVGARQVHVVAAWIEVFRRKSVAKVG